MFNLGTVSYGIAAAAFMVLALLLLTSWRGRLQGALLVAAAAVTALWGGTIAAMQATGAVDWVLGVALLEVLRALVWCLFLVKLLHPAPGWSGLVRGRAGAWSWSLGAVALLLVGIVVMPWFTGAPLADVVGVDARILGQVLFAVAGLVLVEQLYRNTRAENRWAIKYLCFGIGGLWAYDFFLYSDALLFKRIDPDLWQARGLVNALVMPLVAVSAARNPDWSLDVFVSRRMVFHTVAVLGAGIYLLAMAAGGTYIRVYGGDWGHVVQAVFLFGALLVLVMVLSSGQWQSRLKVLLNKHFFNYRYDYREEWLRFIRTLSSPQPGVGLRERAIEALAEIIDSPGGALWMGRDGEHYELVAHWNMSEARRAWVAADSALIRFLGERVWVVNLEEYAAKPDAYAGLLLPTWLAELRRAWLVVPLMHHDGLLGFMVLVRARAPRPFNWEDSDLLKTAGRQAASHLAQMEAAEALADARQFEAFNRLSAFLMHDLKNVVAQLTLLVSNAQRHKENPAFVEDAFKTVENAATKMNRLLTQMRSGSVSHGRPQMVDLASLLEDVVAARGSTQPVPMLKCLEMDLQVRADQERLADVLGHVVQNAQEATPAEGTIEVRLSRMGEAGALIEVVDNGCGMDAAFIRERLFRPFYSTKGKTGMGIGAYETRELVRELGGQLEVDSRPGQGTRFCIQLPLAAAEPSVNNIQQHG